MKKCPQCGYKNGDDAKTCNLCSNSLKGVGLSDMTKERGAAAGTGGMDLYEPRMMKGTDGGAGGAVISRRFTPGGTPSGMVPTFPGPAPTPPPRVANTIRHYAVPPTGAPIELKPGTAYVMGRDEAATIRIQSPKVSRRHCEIRWEGTPPHPVLLDLGSQNGSFLNGGCLPANSKRDLVDRDLIEIGGIAVRYRLLQPGESEAELKKEESSETTLVSEEDEAGLVGNVAILPLAEVLNRLQTLGATGLLVVEAGGAKGALRIEQGQAVAGSFAGLEGLPAITAVQQLTQGRFRFEVQEDDAPAEGEDPPSQPERVTRPMGPAPGTARIAPTPGAPAKPPARPATGPVGKPPAPPANPGGGKPAGPPRPPGTTTRSAPPRRPEDLA